MGKVIQLPESPPYPRSALGLDLAHRRLVLIMVDSNQPGYSLGMTYKERADLFRDWGVVDAIELDGGGSTALLSQPCHTKIPRRQRPVTNILGVRFVGSPGRGVHPPRRPRGVGVDGPA